MVTLFKKLNVKEHDLTENDFVEMSWCAKIRTFFAGDFICRQGEKINKTFILLSGNAIICKSKS